MVERRVDPRSFDVEPGTEATQKKPGLDPGTGREPIRMLYLDVLHVPKINGYILYSWSYRGIARGYLPREI